MSRPGERAGEPLLVAEGGAPYGVAPEGDPVAAWLDLVEAVEALNPEPASAPKPPVRREYRL